MRTDIVLYYLLNQTGEFAGIYPAVIPLSVSIEDGIFATYSIANTRALSSRTSHNEFDTIRCQISIFSALKDAAENAVIGVRDLLDNYSNADLEGQNVHFIRFLNREDMGFIEDEGVFMIALEYEIILKQ